MMQGKVGKKKLTWKNTPQGKVGEGEVTIDHGSTSQSTSVKWKRDEQGIWIETDQGFFGYDLCKWVSDDGQPQYLLMRRNQAEHVVSSGFFKPGEDSDAHSGAKTKKIAKVKAPMPGKILRIHVKAGDSVKKGQSLLVMEAMKMENEIKATQDGVIKEIKVTEGQAIETGGELILLS